MQDGHVAALALQWDSQQADFAPCIEEDGVTVMVSFVCTVFDVHCHDYVFLFIAAPFPSTAHGHRQQVTFVHGTMYLVSFLYTTYMKNISFHHYIAWTLIVLHMALIYIFILLFCVKKLLTCKLI